MSDVLQKFLNTPNRLMGGITPSEAKKMYAQSKRHFARKNLFLIEIGALIEGKDNFNIFATECDYSPYQITGEKYKVGTANVDGISGKEPIELRITTLDDESGSLKKWFRSHVMLTINFDGTRNLPALYALHIRILHSFITDDGDGYELNGLFRPVSLEISLSRRDDALEELSMTFTEIDTFIPDVFAFV